MIRLFTSYYITDNKSRQKEIDFCLLKHRENKMLSEIYVFISPEDLKKAPAYLLKKDRVTCVTISTRVSYHDFFKVINLVSKENDWSVIANSDIFFNDDIGKLKKLKGKGNICFALSRWDVTSFKQDVVTDKISLSVKLHKHRDSQDTWIINGKIKLDDASKVYLGKAGCDNKIAHVLKTYGYEVINACYDLPSYHYHLSDIRTYIPSDKTMNLIIFLLQ